MSEHNRGIRKKRTDMIIKNIYLALFLWFVIHEIVIITDGLNDEHATVDIAVIYGNKVNEDGSLSPRLKARVNKGLELYKSGKAKHIFVSGGLGREGHKEGTKMYEYLVEKGVPKEKITVDDKGNNTKFTTLNFFKKFGKNKSVAVVTQYYHISRAKLSFRNHGVKKVYGAHCNFFEWSDLYSCPREFFAYYKYLIFH